MKILSQHLLGDTVENHNNFDQDRQDLNISTENYCWDNLLSVKTTVFWNVGSGRLVDGWILKMEAFLLKQWWPSTKLHYTIFYKFSLQEIYSINIISFNILGRQIMTAFLLQTHSLQLNSCVLHILQVFKRKGEHVAAYPAHMLSCLHNTVQYSGCHATLCSIHIHMLFWIIKLLKGCRK